MVAAFEEHSQLTDVMANNDSNVHGNEQVIVAAVDGARLNDDRDRNVHEQENTDGEVTTTEKSFAACITKLLVGITILCLVVLIIMGSASNQYALQKTKDFLKWMEEHPTEGVFAFIVVYFAATVLFVPSSLLTLGAGFAFSMAFGLGGGLVLGTLAVFVGAASGAVVAFLLGRYLLRNRMQQLASKYTVFEALELALERRGLVILVLLRLSPIVPFNAVNYIAGVTPVSFCDYCIALFAILPGTILYIFLGASAGSLADSATSYSKKSTLMTVVSFVGVALGIVAIVLTARYAKRELNHIIAERRRSSLQQSEIQQAMEQNKEAGDDNDASGNTSYIVDDDSNSASAMETGRIRSSNPS